MVTGNVTESPQIKLAAIVTYGKQVTKNAACHVTQETSKAVTFHVRKLSALPGTKR